VIPSESIVDEAVESHCGDLLTAGREPVAELDPARQTVGKMPMELPDWLIAHLEDEGAHVDRRVEAQMTSKGVAEIGYLGFPGSPDGLTARGPGLDIIVDVGGRTVAEAFEELVRFLMDFGALRQVHSADQDMDLVAYTARALADETDAEGITALSAHNQVLEAGLITIYARNFTGTARVGDRYLPPVGPQRDLHNWIIHMRNTVYAHADWESLILATEDMDQATEAAVALRTDTSDNAAWRRALETAMAVAYMRPFTRGAWRLPKKYLPASSTGRDLHKRLKQLRNRVYAHSDKASGRSASMTITATTGDIISIQYRSGWLAFPVADLSACQALFFDQRERFLTDAARIHVELEAETDDV
jgi:hypothetical protein